MSHSRLLSRLYSSGEERAAAARAEESSEDDEDEDSDEVGDDERDDDDKGDEEGGSNIPSRIDQSRLDSSDEERAPPLIAWCSCSSFGRAYD
eukprot:CAMPEP_0184375474 /NCGR_PEP_ID=MMETSP0007-20130409/342_1 /TAXON_ID=97485 /ORGANISM="Prymnesium parvum, Strain Texoma1" /LENGTH=91 /DNA_ID=CAMNT_0026718579 /DNA_START=154 /DNA_END=425 /DNA_ORIENTATION=-